MKPKEKIAFKCAYNWAFLIKSSVFMNELINKLEKIILLSMPKLKGNLMRLPFALLSCFRVLRTELQA